MAALDTPRLEQMAVEFFRDRRKTLPELAEPYSMDELLHSFMNLRQSFTRLLKGLSEAQITFSPDANTYSLSEVVSHLVISQGNTYNGMLDLSSSTLPHIDPVPRNPGGGAEKGLTSQILLERLQKATDTLLNIVKVTYDPNNTRLIEDQFFGPMSPRGWMLFQLAHDLDHLKQAQVLRRSPEFPRKAN
jgi:hypothetical protein